MLVAHVTTIDRSLHYLLLNQLQSIQRAGYEVVGMSSPGEEVPVLEAAGIEHVPVPMTRNLTPLADMASFWGLCRAMRERQPTIVHAHTPKAGLLAQLAARLAGVPIVVRTLHGFYFHQYMPRPWQRFYITLERVAASCSDLILSQNSEDIMTAVRERICAPEKIKYLGNGIDLTRFNPGRFSASDITRQRNEIGLSEADPVIGFVGRLAARRKGFALFLEAAQIVVQSCPQARFLVIGEADPGKPDAVEPTAAKEYGVQDACIFLGRQPNSELPLLYLLMDAVVLPSLFEGMPRVVMEASAMGIPAIVSDVKGNREAVEHGHNGLVVPLRDVQILADAVVELLTNRDKAQRMGAEGRLIALARFNEELVFEKVKAEYARLLRERGLPVPQPLQVKVSM